MEVKKLKPEEIARIRRLGHQFAEECNLFGGFNPEYFEPIWSDLMSRGMAEVFYVEKDNELQAFLGAGFIADIYSGLPAANMQFWHIDPAYRKGSVAVRLFRAFEAEAEARGCRKIFVGHKEAFHKDSMSAFFQRNGYVKGETFYWRNK